jgi:hypothetical protein
MLKACFSKRRPSLTSGVDLAGKAWRRVSLSDEDILDLDLC